MRALYLIVPILGILVIAYRYYSAFISARLWVLNDERATPAHLKADGANYFPTSRWVLFGHHFAAIAGAGPRGGDRARRQRVGDVHRLHDDSARARHGLLHVPLADRIGEGSDDRRGHGDVPRRRVGQERRRVEPRPLVHADASSGDARHG